MLIKTQKELKSLVSGLRRELRSQLGLETLSHTRCLELVSRAFGAGSYAELAARLPAGEELAELAQDRNAPRLSNAGQLDLADDGLVLDGLTFMPMQGTVEDIRGCVALCSSGRRQGDGLTPHYEGGTEVNWDGQCARRDAQGRVMWLREDGEMVPEDGLVVVPPSWRGPFVEDLPVRQVLVGAYRKELAARHQDLRACIQSLRQEGLEGDVAGKVARTLGFSLHEAEFEALLDLLEAR